MKRFLFIFTLALLTLVESKNDSSKDAISMVECLKVTSSEIQDSTNKLIVTVENLSNVINENNEKMDACLAMGESNSSTVENITVAQCVIDLGVNFKGQITGVMFEINSDVDYLIEKANSFFKCFLLNPYLF